MLLETYDVPGDCSISSFNSFSASSRALIAFSFLAGSKHSNIAYDMHDSSVETTYLNSLKTIWNSVTVHLSVCPFCVMDAFLLSSC